MIIFLIISVKSVEVSIIIRKFALIWETTKRRWQNERKKIIIKKVNEFNDHTFAAAESELKK